MPGFSEKVLRLLRKIPRGKVTTYKAVARRLRTKAYRAVGNALHSNKHPDSFPCYKVVNSDGSLGGYAFGKKQKALRLAADGIRVKDGRVQDFRQVLYEFK